VDVKRPIVGVLADFHSESLHDPIKAVTIANDQSRTIAVRLNSQNEHPKELQSTMEQITKIWKSAFPNDMFEYKILDDQIARF
jgi:hypothetical protein